MMLVHDNSIDGLVRFHAKEGSEILLFTSTLDTKQTYQMPASLNFATNSSTLATFTPPTRLGGSVTLSVSNWVIISAPSCSGFRVIMGFFLAFMILGSEA